MHDVNSIHVPLNKLMEGQPAIFLIAYAIKTAASVTMCIALLKATRSFIKGNFFTPTNVRLLKISSWAALAHLLGQFFEGMGNNWVSATEGIDQNILPNGIDDPGLIPMYILLMVLSMMSIALGRAVKMQEDQEGLI